MNVLLKLYACVIAVYSPVAAWKTTNLNCIESHSEVMDVLIKLYACVIVVFFLVTTGKTTN